jgi:ribosomal protein L37AE/L43A
MEDYPRTLAELERRFATDAACRAYVFRLRWPDGFVCPRCAGRTAWGTHRGVWVCAACGHQASVTAGTIFQDTRLPLTLWFRAIWWVTS